MYEAALAIKRVWDALPIWSHVVIAALVPLLALWLFERRCKRWAEPATLTEEEVIRIAKSVAAAEGWRWEEPVSVTRHPPGLFTRTGLLWHVMTNAHCRGCNANVWIDDATRQVTQKAFAPR